MGAPKLDEATVRKIRADYNNGNGLAKSVLSVRYDVCITNITHIVTGKTWKHLLPKAGA